MRGSAVDAVRSSPHAGGLQVSLTRLGKKGSICSAVEIAAGDEDLVSLQDAEDVQRDDDDDRHAQQPKTDTFHLRSPEVPRTAACAASA